MRSPRRVTCGNCNRDNHKTEECRIKCGDCGKRGHWRGKCPERMCYKCSQRGHNASECSNWMSPQCRKCGGTRSETYLADQRKTIYYCPNCKRIVNPENAKVAKGFEFWTA